MSKKIFYLPKTRTFLVGENYSTYSNLKCLNGKWKISQGVGSFLERDNTAMEYVPDPLIGLQNDYFLKRFVYKFMDIFNHSRYSNLILVVPNGEFRDLLFEIIADILDEQNEESCTLHFVQEPPLKSLYTTTLSLPFPVDDLVSGVNF